VTHPDTSWLNHLRGVFLAFEGPDGSGKSTQLRRLIELCTTGGGAGGGAGGGLTVCEVREPGGSQVGEQIRQVLLNPSNEMSLRCEMLLYMASRNQLVEERIKPGLSKGHLVIADRFVSSTYAYQGAGGGIPAEEIRAVANVATQGTFPDLVLLFDVDQVTAARRTKGVEKVGKKKSGGTLSNTLFDDRIEQRGSDFHERVRQGYLAQAKADPARHLVIDATKTPDQVWEATVAGLCEWACARGAGKSGVGAKA
jgi:dTMP kinase